MFRSLVTVFAGYWQPSLATRTWVALFFLLVRLKRWVPLAPRLNTSLAGIRQERSVRETVS
jgi:hypothetical protein